MTFLLVLHFEFQGVRQDLRALIARDAQVCQIAGAGMAAVLEAANPGLAWVDCRAQSGD